MRKLILFILLPIVTFAQKEHKYILISDKDSTVVKDAYIFVDDKLTTYSDENGVFKLKNKKFEIITIKHLNFYDLSINTSDLFNNKKIYITPKNEELNEVVVSGREVTTKKVLPKQSLLSKIGYYVGHKANTNAIYATYIPYNKKYKNSTIKNILIETSKGYWGDPNKQYMPFRVNLYTVDTLTKLPDQKILPDTLLISKKIGGDSKYVSCNIEEYLIDFPKEGIFVAIKTLSKYQYRDDYEISNEAPAFKIIRESKNSKNITYRKWFNSDGSLKKDWNDPEYGVLGFIYNFGIEVEILK